MKIPYLKYIGIDFEFNNINNKREIALCQMNMETERKRLFYIFILSTRF